jgi:uncharacterized protein HemX
MLAFILIGGAAGYFFGVKPAIERKALEAERARQEQQLAVDEKDRMKEKLLDEQRRAEEAQQQKDQLQEKLEAREQRLKEREQRLKARRPAQQRPAISKPTCAPDDPLCGLDLD